MSLVNNYFQIGEIVLTIICIVLSQFKSCYIQSFGIAKKNVRFSKQNEIAIVFF